MGWVIGSFLAGMALGWALEEWRWWRILQRYLPQPVANTKPPTTAELASPEWITQP
jgi:hypothetical protein